MAKVAAWSSLAAIFAAWLLVILFGLASSGTPLYVGGGWSQAEINAQTHFTHVLNVSFLLLPAFFFADMIALWLLYKQKTVL